MGSLQYGILGLQPWAAGLIFLAILGLGWLYIKQRKKGQTLKEQHDRILCTFYGANGKKRRYWCDVIEQEVKLSPEEKKKLDKIAKEYGYKGDLEKMGSVKAPGDIQLDKYFTNAEFIFSDWWPPDKPLSQQKEIKTCEFMDGIPLPIIGINLAKWTSTMIQELASSLVGLASDADTLKALNAQDHTFWNNLSKAVQMLAQLPQIKIAAFAAAGGGLIAAFIGWMVMNKVDMLISLFMPKGG